MKTIDKVQKTGLRLLAVIIGFAMLSHTVTAVDLKESFNPNQTNHEIALTMADIQIELQPVSTTVRASNDIRSFTNYFKTESENKLKLEEWMTNADLFCNDQYPTKKKIISTSCFVYRELDDPRLKLESWMLNHKYWTVKR